MAKRPTCLTPDCRRRTPGTGREYCTGCRPDTTDSTSPDLELLAAAAVDAPPAASTVCVRRDDRPTQMKTLGRCPTCKSVLQVDVFDVPENPEAWAETYAIVLTALHGHQVTLVWALVSPFAGEAPARPRIGLAPRLGVADG